MDDVSFLWFFSICFSLACNFIKNIGQCSHWQASVGIIPCTEALCRFSIKPRVRWVMQFLTQGTKIRFILKFSFSKNATKFETIFHLICQIKWKIVSKFCGLFRMSELYQKKLMGFKNTSVFCEWIQHGAYKNLAYFYLPYFLIQFPPLNSFLSLNSFRTKFSLHRTKLNEETI